MKPRKRSSTAASRCSRADDAAALGMSDVLIPARELNFLLWNWLDAEALLDRPGQESHDRETVDAVLNLSASLADRLFLPHFKDADRHEPWVDADGQVHVLPAIAEALREYASLGLPGAGFSPELGGMGLPALIVSASLAQFMAASLATAAYPMLTMGNARLLATFGNAAQIAAFARPQIEGSALGTMCLSEPQAGSGLGDVRTRATADGDQPALGLDQQIPAKLVRTAAGAEIVDTYLDQIEHAVYV